MPCVIFGILYTNLEHTVLGGAVGWNEPLRAAWFCFGFATFLHTGSKRSYFEVLMKLKKNGHTICEEPTFENDKNQILRKKIWILPKRSRSDTLAETQDKTDSVADPE